MPEDHDQSLDASRVLAVILGGGRGARLFPLTRERAKPAVPLAGNIVWSISPFQLHQRGY